MILHNCTKARDLSRVSYGDCIKPISPQQAYPVSAGLVTGRYFSPFGVFFPRQSGLPREAFEKIFCCGNLIPHGKCPAAVAHTVTAAFRTGMDIVIPDFQQDFIHWEAGKICLEFPVSLNVKNNSQVPAFPAVVQKAVVTDLLEPGWQHMHHEAADEFFTGYCDGFLLPGPVILCRERNFCFRYLLDPCVCDGDPVGITAEIFNGIAISIEGFLDLGIPILLV